MAFSNGTAAFRQSYRSKMTSKSVKRKEPKAAATSQGSYFSPAVSAIDSYQRGKARRACPGAWRSDFQAPTTPWAPENTANGWK